MTFQKRMLEDVNLTGKRVIMRADFNVPILNGVVEDNYRILQSIPTIEYATRCGASLILVSHLGRPAGMPDSRYSLQPVAKELTKLLGKRVKMVGKTIGSSVKKAIAQLKRGDILLLENVRFHPEETSKDKTLRENFASHLAELGDVYVNDAFAVSHREHASTSTIARLMPSCAGLLIKREILAFEQILYVPPRPFIVLLGGIKIETKLPLIRNLLPKVDRLLIGGGMAYNFFKAINLNVGTFKTNDTYVSEAEALLKQSDGKIELPSDVVAGQLDLELRKPLEKLKVYSREKIPEDKSGYDIGPQTIRRWGNMLSSARSILWNGPVGFFECKETQRGTFEIAKLLAKLTAKGTLTIVGGGDSAAAIKKAGLMKKISHLSTGGGAFLMYLEGSPLPGIVSLEDKI
ncbi:phosphoglycerate kinase [Spirochaetota bacterium]|nr:phosphoglycerate kinase [Spirochaetota bacterium]